MSAPCLYLASASPRRRVLLERLGLKPIVRPAPIDERPAPGETPEALVLRLAETKGRWLERHLADPASGLVLAADTAVVLDGSVLGKPVDRAEAASMLRRLRGRVHEVLTGVFLLRRDEERSTCAFDRSRVHFRAFDDATLEAYVQSGEGDDKAGAYGLQGAGARLVERVDGSWSNVVGLPLERLPGWLESIGIDLEELRR